MKNYFKSLKYAMEGLWTFYKTESNSKIHLLAAGLAILTARYFEISSKDWMILFLAILLVFITELFNTAIELICDQLSLETDPRIKKIKDMSAGAVLLASVFAIIVALSLFFFQ